MTRVLVVDDEPQILRAMRVNLTAREFEVAVAATGRAALKHASVWHPDLIVLELGLPDLDGLDVIHGLRGWTNIPILVLSGRVGSRDKIEALDAGADDYVTKPFDIEELIARIRAITRRVAGGRGSEPAWVQVGDHIVDLAARTVSDDVHLTPTEWHLLELLVRNPGKLVTQRRILTEVWGEKYLTQTHYVRQYMAQLRRKLERDPARPVHLVTEPGMGCRFTPRHGDPSRDAPVLEPSGGARGHTDRPPIRLPAHARRQEAVHRQVPPRATAAGPRVEVQSTARPLRVLPVPHELIPNRR
ncbi:MAG TPA: response regulator [Sporichthyaceae bacterium]|jgi:two-component system KDP operon response regulator KdpE|nr:response regulator [Sporichthyaceae bacterium]